MNGWIELEQLAGFASELLVRFQQERVAVMEGNTQSETHAVHSESNSIPHHYAKLQSITLRFLP